MPSIIAKFPETIYITFEKEDSYEDGGFLSTAKTMEEAVTSTKREAVATYKRVKVEEWKLTPQVLTEIG